MFNSTYAPTHHNTRIDVVQQPNDAADAARLHGEIKKTAEQEIIKAVRVEGNGFNSVLHINLDPVSYDTMFRAIYDLNGVRHTTDYVHKKDWLGPELEVTEERIAAIRGLIDKMATQIAAEVLMPALKPHIDNRTL